MIRTRVRMACAKTCDAQAIADRLKAQFLLRPRHPHAGQGRTRR
jgi:hypothetical protein